MKPSRACSSETSELVPGLRSRGAPIRRSGSGAGRDDAYFRSSRRFTPAASQRPCCLGEWVALVRGAAMNWEPTPFEGVFMARLCQDPIRGELASLVRNDA